MTDLNEAQFFSPDAWYRPNQGPRYLQLYRHISLGIHDGHLPPNTQLPPERKIGEHAGISRVTVRRAIERLVEEGKVIQRQGAGSFIRDAREEPRLEHSLSSLTSFTQYMRLRGITPGSQVISAGVFSPAPQEQVALGLGTGEHVSRIKRVRKADGVPMALEISAVPTDVLPDPAEVVASLYDLLREYGKVPERAVQRITAENMADHEAQILGVPAGSAVLKIHRTSYISSGRPIEFTTGFYRSDMYDFVAELRLDNLQE